MSLERRTPMRRTKPMRSGGKLGNGRKPLRAQPRGKGNRGERQVVDIIHEAGWLGARRNFGSGAQGGGDITWGPEGLHLEVKWRERLALWEWIAQAEDEARPTDTACVVMRRNASGWWAVIPDMDFYPLRALVPTRAVFATERWTERCDLWRWAGDALDEAEPLRAMPTVRFRRDRSDWYRALPFWELLLLLRSRDGLDTPSAARTPDTARTRERE